MKKLTLIATVVILATMMTTSCWATTPTISNSTYEEFTPQVEKQMETWYWEVIFSQIHTDPAYYQKKDGFKMRDEVRIAAEIIQDEMLGFPASSIPGDVNAINWQRHWADFYSRIARGEFTNKEMRHHWRRIRRQVKKYGGKLW